MANTPFLDLVKPAGTDRALVSVINSNSDKIDTGVSTLSEQIEYTAITSGSMNSYTGNNGHTLYYKGSDISQFTDIPSATSGNAWPFVLEVIKMGPYAKQILHVFTTPTKMNNPPTYIRQQTYQSGSIVWGGWYSADDQIAGFTEGKILSGTFNMNDIKTAGTYFVGDPANVSNWPHPDGWLIFQVIVANNSVVQIVFGGRNTQNPGNRYTYTRMFYAGAWKPWIYFVGSLA